MEDLTSLCTETEGPDDPDMKPYRRLLFAVFVRAVRDLEDPEHRQEALNWFSGRNTDVRFSFQDILDHAHIDPRYLELARDRYVDHKEAA